MINSFKFGLLSGHLTWKERKQAFKALHLAVQLYSSRIEIDGPYQPNELPCNPLFSFGFCSGNHFHEKMPYSTSCDHHFRDKILRTSFHLLDIQEAYLSCFLPYFCPCKVHRLGQYHKLYLICDLSFQHLNFQYGKSGHLYTI